MGIGVAVLCIFDQIIIWKFIEDGLITVMGGGRTGTVGMFKVGLVMLLAAMLRLLDSRNGDRFFKNLNYNDQNIILFYLLPIVFIFYKSTFFVIYFAKKHVKITVILAVIA